MFFLNSHFFSIFGHLRPGSGSVFSLKCWIRMKLMRIRNPAVSGFWLLMVTPCSCCVEAVLAGLMDVVCVLWSSRDAEIQAQENIRVQLELQAAKTSLLLFKVGGLPAGFSQVCRIHSGQKK
jgi:hypothetical protein